MAKKKLTKKAPTKSSKSKTVKKKSRSRSSNPKLKEGPQIQLLPIYIILGILFLGYIFYHSTVNKTPAPGTSLEQQTTSK
jgi:hypothetical protein